MMKMIAAAALISRISTPTLLPTPVVEVVEVTAAGIKQPTMKLVAALDQSTGRGSNHNLCNEK